MMITMEDIKKDSVLLKAKSGEIFGEKVLLCFRGYRHYVPSAERLKEYGFCWPDDVLTVEERIISAFRPAGHIPTLSATLREISPSSGSVHMREALANELNGTGVEIGAGASAFPLPLHCRVVYVDRYGIEELKKNKYATDKDEDLIIPDEIADAEKLNAFRDNSLDFIVMCHVIEHTKNPLGAIQHAYSKLKAGGKLLMVIPDKERTFDRLRNITEIGHLVDDFMNPDPLRDYMHYEEFYRLAIPVNKQDLDYYAAKMFEIEYPIHFHVWNYLSFCEMLNYINNHVCSWSSIRTFPSMQDPSIDIEFYALLTR
jgi:SAM-dependent methyltransferase